jgi:transposase-like protein
MPTPPLSPALAREALEAVEQTGGNKTKAAQLLGINRATLDGRLRVAQQYQRNGTLDGLKDEPEPVRPEVPHEAILNMLRRQPLTLAEIGARYNISKGAALDALEAMQARGVNLHQFDDKWSIEKSMEPAHVAGALFEYVSRPDNTFKFGVTSDNHLCSKYERLDVLNDLYDEFERAGVDRAFNAGNWVDGECRFNKHELLAHGMDGQLAYLAKHFPQRPGITTYAVAGDDHEGWWAQREGIDIGRRAEQTMREHGRDDWVNLGYMEAHVKLVNANTGKFSILAVVHPGGGSAYALSYAIQKIIESLDGGEKPAVGIYGHYHKQMAANIRNVWCLQPGCTKDQDSFMRKKKIEAHVGGVIVDMVQDPKTGAIIGFKPDMRRYFNRGYYDGRWSHSGPVTLPERSIA